MPKVPNVEVKIIGANGNVFNLIGICRRAAKPELTQEEMNQFMSEVTSGDYNNALRVISEWFTVV